MLRALLPRCRRAFASAPLPTPPALQPLVDAQKRAEAELAELVATAREPAAGEAESELVARDGPAGKEWGGPKGKEPTRCVDRGRRGCFLAPLWRRSHPLCRFGDWERNGRCSDF